MVKATTMMAPGDNVPANYQSITDIDTAKNDVTDVLVKVNKNTMTSYMYARARCSLPLAHALPS